MNNNEVAKLNKKLLIKFWLNKVTKIYRSKYKLL